MKNTIRTTLLALIIMMSCKEDDVFSPAQVTITKTEAWPLQVIKAQFDNPEYAKFPVKFGTTSATSIAMRDGMNITVPSLTADQSVKVTMETPKGTLVLNESFLIRGNPSVQYAAPTTFSYRIPLKIILKNKDYFSGISNVYFCPTSSASAQCLQSNFTTSGDTLIFQASLDPASYTVNLIGNPSFEADPSNASAYEALSKISLSEVVNYRPSFRQTTVSGKAGANFNIVFNDTDYYPDDLNVILKSETGVETKLANKGWDIVGAAGYINATFGAFEIPALAVGNYTLIVKDEKNVIYLAEKTNVFTIIN